MKTANITHFYDWHNSIEIIIGKYQFCEILIIGQILFPKMDQFYLIYFYV